MPPLVYTAKFGGLFHGRWWVDGCSLRHGHHHGRRHRRPEEIRAHKRRAREHHTVLHLRLHKHLLLLLLEHHVVLCSTLLFWVECKWGIVILDHPCLGHRREHTRSSQTERLVILVLIFCSVHALLLVRRSIVEIIKIDRHVHLHLVQ